MLFTLAKAGRLTGATCDWRQPFYSLIPNKLVYRYLHWNAVTLLTVNLIFQLW